MKITARTMDDIAEIALTSHIEGKKFKEIVAAVLKHHTMSFGAFGCFHQLPAFIKRTGCRNLHSDMFSMFHGINSHWCMKIPACADIYQVNVRVFTKAFPCLFGASIFLSLRQSCSLKNGLSAFNSSRTFVTSCNYINTLYVCHSFNSFASTVTNAYKSYAHTVEFGCSIISHIHRSIVTENIFYQISICLGISIFPCTSAQNHISCYDTGTNSRNFEKFSTSSLHFM